ncbi:MAG: tRNA (N6-threonylcarbamoyladenosine(37)-N6)-methyltransferase TrmO [Clostridiales bacterium]|nr:tRNA (N6-threonylcarbamoyladenosine(37)-N6)-methyltransferase TrmO [Clostridiales bacterium]
MEQLFPMQVVARIRSDFSSKFGVPRQSGLVDALEAAVVFEPEFRNPDAVRGLEGFSHIWLIWAFHQAVRDTWSPTVRPPRLGGNRRMGVFATRSPFRPNNLGLSCVKLVGVRLDEKLGPVIDVSGADLVDGTPILDIKPYLPYADCHPEATGGFTDPLDGQTLQVNCDPALLSNLTEEQKAGLMGVLACDPRPRYQEDPDRVYGLAFAGKNVKFTVRDGVLTVVAVED